MPESTTIIAFDQPADSLMAAVLPPRADKPAMQLLSSELTHVGRFVDEVRRGGGFAVVMRPAPAASRCTGI